MRTGYSLDHDETVIREVHGHWIGLLPVIVTPVVFIGVALGLVYAYGQFANELSFIPASAITLIDLILFLLAGAVFMAGLFVFRQNKFILTDKHIILIIQQGLFSRTVSQLTLSRLQDVKAVRKGVLATILNYGDIEIETAGEDENFIFSMAPHPQQLADQCLAVHDQRPDALPENPSVPTPGQGL
jgi:uncharacterized membrane protein YdbT with pleckstrin-like domain